MNQMKGVHRQRKSWKMKGSYESLQMTMTQSKLQTEKLEGDMRQLLTEKQNEVTNMQKQLDSARNLEKNIDDLKW